MQNTQRNRKQMRAMRWLSVAVLLLTSAVCRAELTIKKISSNKVFYRAGEPISVQVEIANPDPAPSSAQLKVDLVHDYDSAIPLHNAPVTVEAKSSKIVPMEVHPKADLWLGVEARATLTREGQEIESKFEPFTCARTVHQVLIAGLGNTLMANFDKNRDAIIDYALRFYRASYGNYWEWFAWAPSDYDDMTPDVDRWWAGQAAYRESKPSMLAMNKRLTENGVQIFAYGKAGGGGPRTFEFFRRHPELVIYTEGRPSIENYDAASLDFVTALGPPKEEDQRGVPGSPDEMEKAGYKGVSWFQPYAPPHPVWSAVWYDSANDEVIRHGSDEMGKSALQLGFQGVRFDGEYMTSRHQLLDGTWNGPPAYDNDAADARLVRNMKQWTWAIKPGYLFAYNTGLNFRWNIKANNTPASFREKCKDEGLIAREELSGVGNIPWIEYMKLVRHDSDIARFYGGHSALYPFHRNPRFLYCYIIAYALRSHVMYGYVGTPTKTDPMLLKPEISKFATRNAGLLWDDGTHTWAQAGQELQVNSTRDLWWEPFASVRPRQNGKATQFIVHLINPPDGKTTYGENNDASPARVPADGMPSEAAENVEVRWTKPRGFKRAYVTDLDRNDMQPVEARTEGGQLLFSVPDIGHWSILVIEADTKTPEPVWEFTKEDANVKLPTPQELGLAMSNTTSSTHWSQTLQGEDYYPSPQAVTDRFKELDAKGGISLHTAPGRGTGYMAVGTYFYPHIPGHYRATFRLKTNDNTIDKPLLQLGVQESIAKPLAGVPTLTKIITIKCTDFKAPNVYQDFQVPFDHADIGFHGMLLLYQGAAEVWWDQTELEMVKPWTKAELEQHYAALARPADLQPVHDDKLNVLLVRGVWNRNYHIDDAVARLGEGAKSGSAYTMYNQFIDTIFTGFDFDWKPLFAQDVIVLTNAEMRGLPYGKVKMLQQWVRDGGGLVILGGLMTLGQNNNMGHGWPDMLPVQLQMPFEVRKCAAPLAFGVPSKELGVKVDKWQNPPLVMYRHMVKAKPGATILIPGTNGEPLLVGGRYGKGRVVVFTGTVLGDAPTGKVAFWNSPAWPGLLAAAMRWSHPS